MIISGEAGADELDDIREASSGAAELTKQLVALASKKRQAFGQLSRPVRWSALTRSLNVD